MTLSSQDMSQGRWHLESVGKGMEVTEDRRMVLWSHKILMGSQQVVEDPTLAHVSSLSNSVPEMEQLLPLQEVKSDLSWTVISLC